MLSLSSNRHRDEECFRSRVCGLNGCRSYHHRMLHENRAEIKAPQNDSITRSDLPPTSVNGSAEERETDKRTHMTTTTMNLTVPLEFVALRTGSSEVSTALSHSEAR